MNDEHYDESYDSLSHCIVFAWHLHYTHCIHYIHCICTPKDGLGYHDDGEENHFTEESKQRAKPQRKRALEAQRTAKLLKKAKRNNILTAANGSNGDAASNTKSMWDFVKPGVVSRTVGDGKEESAGNVVGGGRGRGSGSGGGNRMGNLEGRFDSLLETLDTAPSSSRRRSGDSAGLRSRGRSGRSRSRYGSRRRGRNTYSRHDYEEEDKEEEDYQEEGEE